MGSAGLSPYVVFHEGPDELYDAGSWVRACELAQTINGLYTEAVEAAMDVDVPRAWATPYPRSTYEQVIALHDASGAASGLRLDVVTDDDGQGGGHVQAA